MKSLKLPLWLRFVLLVGVVGVVSGAASLPIGTGSSGDAERRGRLDRRRGRQGDVRHRQPARFDNASVRLNVVDSGTAVGAAKAFSDGKVDLAVVRGDVGDLSKAQAVVVMSHVVALVIAPPGSTIDSMDKLKGRRVGVTAFTTFAPATAVFIADHANVLIF